MKFDYVARETFTNLRRNITLTIAAIITVAVSLALFGSTLLLGQGVDNVSARWQDGIELIAFLKADITDEQRAAHRGDLDENPEVGELDVRRPRREPRGGHAPVRAQRGRCTQKIESGGTRVPDSYRLTPAPATSTSWRASASSSRPSRACSA